MPQWPSWVVDQAAATGPGLRGLFCGGTLADEAMLIAAERLGGIRSNIPPPRSSPSAPTCATPATWSSTSATTCSPRAEPTP